MPSLISTSSVLLLTALTSSVTASFGRVCQNISIPVTISSRQPVFNPLPFETNADGSAFSQALRLTGRNLTADLFKEFQTLQGTYKVGATFCHPATGISDAPLQILTHGAGFDRLYWDFSYNNYNYSYVSNAVDKHGYNTLAIDRLGIGESSHGDPLNVVQAAPEVEALNQVTLAARANKLPKINKPGGFKKVVHVGHSFGSVLSFWLSSKYPNNTDGLVLTGWSTDFRGQAAFLASWNMRPARLNQPFRFGNHSRGNGFKGDFLPILQQYVQQLGATFTTQELWNDIAETEIGNLVVGLNDTSITPQNLPGGYVTWADFTSNQIAFLLPGFFDLGLGIFTEHTKQPTTAGEFITISAAPQTSSFTGPVLVLTGQQDLPFCNGDCLDTGGAGGNLLEGIRGMAFPNLPAQKFKAYVQPNMAHGINAHYNASGAYDVANSFLGANGLPAST